VKGKADGKKKRIRGPTKIGQKGVVLGTERRTGGDQSASNPCVLKKNFKKDK